MLEVNPQVFKAYDIRGIYGKDFDNELARLIGLAYIDLRRKDNDYKEGQEMTVAVSCDMRLSSPALKESLIQGLREAGANVADLGETSTPTFYFAVGHYGYSGGIMISASHNPKEWNGFKLVRSKGLPISGETGLQFMKERILKNDFKTSDKLGKIIKNDSAGKDEIAYALQTSDVSKIKPLKVVADAASGMGSLYLESLFKTLPQIDLIKLNFALDGSFPAHEANPSKEENLKEIQEEVIKQKADLGITTDGDGDRVFFIDNEGRTINPAIVRGLLAEMFLRDKPESKIGYDVRPGRITVDLIKEYGGTPVMTRVGHSLIKEQMLKEDIYFAGESSGHFYWRGEAGCFEYPTVMILKLLALFSETDKAIADYVKPYERYFSSGEINRDIEDKEEVVSRIKEKYSDGEIKELDGISVEYPDYWFNVRPSNTEPVMRLNLEAKSLEIMEQKRDEILGLMK